MDEQIQEIATNHLPEVPELTERNRIIAFGAAQANYLRGNYDRADDYLIDYRLNESLEGLLLSAQIAGTEETVGLLLKWSSQPIVFPAQKHSSCNLVVSIEN